MDNEIEEQRHRVKRRNNVCAKRIRQLEEEGQLKAGPRSMSEECGGSEGGRTDGKELSRRPEVNSLDKDIEGTALHPEKHTNAQFRPISRLPPKPCVPGFRGRIMLRRSSGLAGNVLALPPCATPTQQFAPKATPTVPPDLATMKMGRHK